MKECPYNLYKSMEQIYYTKIKDVSVAYNIFEQIVMPLNKKKINLEIFRTYKESDHYTKFNNVHMINNFYNDEQTKLVVNNSFMKLTSTMARPSFFIEMKKVNNIFVCDFDNKDYFWLDVVPV